MNDSPKPPLLTFLPFYLFTFLPLVVFPVQLAVEGPCHLLHLFIEHGHLIRFQSLLQVQGQLAFVQQLPVVHHHEQFQGTPRVM